MSRIAIDFPSPARSVIFDNGTLNYLLPEICAITELQNVTSEFTESGFCHVFKIYLTHGVDIEFGFETGQDGRAARKDLIGQLSNYWGPDKMVFANGYEYDVIIIPAIQTVTDVFNKDKRSFFSIAIDSVTHPVNLIFMDQVSAKLHHKNLLDAIEIHRCQTYGGQNRRLKCG